MGTIVGMVFLENITMHNYSDTDWFKHFWMGRDACPQLMNQLFKRRLQTGEIQMMTSAQHLHFTWVGKSARGIRNYAFTGNQAYEAMLKNT